MKKIAAVILAAGLGKRMKSKKPKVLHRVGGWSLISFPVDLAGRLGCDPIVVVVGHGKDLVEAEVRGQKFGDRVEFALQAEQLGTGHAVACAMSRLKSFKGAVLILSGDVPLLDRGSVARLRSAYSRTRGPLSFLTLETEEKLPYGRIIREGNRVVAIREERDCTPAEKAIRELNAGIYLADAAFIRKAVKKLKNDNDQKEFYLTDLVADAAKIGEAAAVKVNRVVVRGINDRLDLAEVDALIQRRIATRLIKNGVTILKPDSVRVDLGVKVGADTELGRNVELLGATKIGRGCRIESGAIIADSEVADGAVIKAYSVLQSAKVGKEAQIGPMSRLRPGANIGKAAKVGNFVEVKNTTLGKGSKASHLAYLGDGEIGEGVNVGAGTIFCNYDGFQKHKTVLEDEVFIGSDSQLVAPVTVGRGAYVASGSTVTKDVPPDALAVARSKQENKKGVAAVLRRRLKALKEKARKEKEKEKGS